MWSQSVFYLALAVMSILGGVVGRTVVIDHPRDNRIEYGTGSPTGDAWRFVPGSRQSGCETPQMLTDKLGDYMSFTFTGTGFSVLGTMGVRQGRIEFFYDDSSVVIDRGWPELVCDEVIFEATGLPYGEYKVLALFVGKGTNPKTGKEDGVFSVQRIMYTVPDKP